MSVTNSTTSKFLTVLQEIAESAGFVNYHITFGGNSKIAEGYVGNITPVEIASKEQKLNLVIKSCDGSDKIRGALPIEKIFNRENLLYETIFPLYQEFESTHGLTPSVFAPEHFRACTKNQHDADAVILRDMKKIGYSLYNKKELLDDAHVKLVIARYAKLHAISLAFQDQKPERFKALVDSMEDFYHQLFEETDFIEIFSKQLRRASTSLDAKVDPNVKNVFEKFITDIRGFILGMPGTLEEHFVIIHGDCWKNNMMFKYDNLNDLSSVSDVSLIDFQIARIGSPMLDFANFFYACSSKTILDNVDYYLNYYYENLSNHISSLGSDPSKLYPSSVMLDHFKQYARYGLIVRIASFMILLSEEKEHKGFSDVLESDKKLEDVFDYEIVDDTRYNDLCSHAIIHFVEKKLI